MAAISSGLPSRPIGWRSMKAWRTLSIGSPLDLLEVSIRPSSEGSRSCRDRSRCNARLADEVGRDRLGEADDGGLRGAVDVAVGDAAHRGGARRDIDDRASALLQHARQEGADRTVHRLDVEIEREVPVGVRGGEDRAVVNEAGAVEEDVDRPDLARERLDRLVRAHVELARLGVQAGEPGDVDVGRDHARPLPCEGLGRRAPDARRGRRQQGRLAGIVQPSRPLLPSMFPRPF